MSTATMSDWIEARGNEYHRRQWHGHYVHDVRIKRMGPVTLVALKVEDESPDLSYLGEWTSRPEYPYWDNAAKVLVTDDEEITVTTLELYRVNRTAQPLGTVQPGESVFCGETDIADSETLAQAQERLVREKWKPAYTGFVPEFETNERYELRDVAWGYETKTEVVDGRKTTRYVPFRDDSYDPSEYANDRDHHRYIHGFQHDPKKNPDEIPSCISDAKRLASYTDDWSMVGIVVEARLGADEDGNGGTVIDHAGMDSLWGIESDSDDDYFWDEVAEECAPSAEELVKSLREEAKANIQQARTIRSYLRDLEKRST